MQQDERPSGRPGPRAGVLMVLAVLCALEAGLRISGYRPRLAVVPDAELGWVLLPDQRAWQDGREVRTNAEGFYDDEWGDGPVECAVLGSSSSVGPWVRADERWPELVEAELGEGEVMNCAVSGYGMEQMRRVYDLHVARRRPRVLVIELSEAAVLPPVTPAAGAGGHLSRWLARSAVHDAWCRYVTRDRGARAAPGAVDPAAEARRMLLRSIAEGGESPGASPHWRAVEQHLLDLADAQAEHGGHLVVAGAPLASHGTPTDRTRPVAWLATRPIADRAVLVDPIARFRDAEGRIDRSLFSSRDPLHWSARGHAEFAAAVLARWPRR